MKFGLLLLTIIIFTANTKYVVTSLHSQPTAEGLGEQGFLNISDYHRMRIWWKFENDEVIFLVDCFTNVWAGIGFGENMRGADYIVLQFYADSVFITDRLGIGYVTPQKDILQDASLIKYYKDSEYHHIIKFSRLLYTGDKRNMNLKLGTGEYFQWAIHNVTDGQEITATSLQIMAEHRRYGSFVAALSNNPKETEEILENWVDETEYEKLDNHSKVLFLLWCPFADFAIILVRYFKSKWKNY